MNVHHLIYLFVVYLVNYNVQLFIFLERLWGDHGQSKLEGSRICVINASATGTEILKSLILPGCGSFTILDNSTVSLQDIGNK